MKQDVFLQDSIPPPSPNCSQTTLFLIPAFCHFWLGGGWGAYFLYLETCTSISVPWTLEVP